MELLLLTGFLGAGKTTLLHTFLRMYRNAYVIVNEFGKVGIDGALIRAEGAMTEEICDGSIFCTCRQEQFEAALRHAVERRPAWILVEASGLSDPTLLRTILAQDTCFATVTYRGCIGLADAVRLPRLINTVRACHKQLSVSRLILLTKTDLATPAQEAQTRAMLAQRYPLTPVRVCVHGAWDPHWLTLLAMREDTDTPENGRDITLQKACVYVLPTMTSTQTAAFIRLFVEETYRVKGLLQLADGMFLVDCVGASVCLHPCTIAPTEAGNALVALAGAGMQLRMRLREAMAWYPEGVKEK